MEMIRIGKRTKVKGLKVILHDGDGQSKDPYDRLSTLAIKMDLQYPHAKEISWGWHIMAKELPFTPNDIEKTNEVLSWLEG